MLASMLYDWCASRLVGLVDAGQARYMVVTGPCWATISFVLAPGQMVWRLVGDKLYDGWEAGLVDQCFAFGWLPHWGTLQKMACLQCSLPAKV